MSVILMRFVQGLVVPRGHFRHQLRRLFIFGNHVTKVFFFVLVGHFFQISHCGLEQEQSSSFDRSEQRSDMTSLDFCAKRNNRWPLECRLTNSERSSRTPQTNGTSLNKHSCNRRLANARTRDSIASFSIDLKIRLRKVESILEFFESGSETFLYRAL